MDRKGERVERREGWKKRRERQVEGVKKHIEMSVSIQSQTLEGSTIKVLAITLFLLT